MADAITEIIDHTGQIRHMGLNALTEENRLMRAGRNSFKQFLESIGKTLIPRSQWVEIDRSKTLDTKFINDQRSSSGCTGWSAVQAFMRLRVMRGMTFQRLSGAYVYSQINGNRDQGSVIVDALTVLEEKGTCLESEFDFPKIFDKDIPPEARKTAPRFMLLRGLTCDSFDEAGTALQMGFLPQYPIMVGQNYEKFDNGVCGFTPGYGNHSVHADGMKMVKGVWVLDSPGTWGTKWGPFGNGRGYHQERAFAGQGGIDDSYIHIDAGHDPLDPNLPPVPVE